MKNLQDIIITPKMTITDCLVRFNKSLFGHLVIVNKNHKLLGIVSAGDIRRALINEINLNSPVSKIMNRKPILLQEHLIREQNIDNILKSDPKFKNIYFIPLIDEEFILKDIIFNLISFQQPQAEVEALKISVNSTLKETMHFIDKIGFQLAIVVNSNGKFKGLVTDKDIRKSILDGYDPEGIISKVMQTKLPIIYQGASNGEIRRILKSFKGKRRRAPILDDQDRIVGLFTDLPIPTPLQRKRVLIIGGAGYIGSILVRKLLEKGYFVRVLDLLVYGDVSIADLYVNGNFEIIKGDIRHIESVMKAIRGMDAVIHLAAIVGDPAGSIDPKITLESNYFATRMIAEICKYYQINNFIFASTCSVYGRNKELISEESPLNPVSLYARSKKYSEEALLNLKDSNFLPVILRLGTVFGLSPRPRFDLAVNIMTAKAVCEKKITVIGSDQWRPFLHVNDAAEAFLHVLEAPRAKVAGEIFNVGKNEMNLTFKKLSEIIKSEISDCEVMYKDLEPKDIRNYNVSFDKIRKRLQFIPKYSLEYGIKELRKALTENRIRNYQNPEFHNYSYLKSKLLETDF
ncbi:MAG: NAD-dependent epimerase/dehydratase family protein [Candidatus Hodarchaeales archaeon]|jgi:nucleoside-diphosphate-sugar epimerase/CBS domain-containing protein